jgi:phosphonate transport system permease protein
MALVENRHLDILADDRRATFRHAGLAGVIVLVCIIALWITGFFDAERLLEGLPALGQLASEMVPPDFTRWQHGSG